MSTAIFYFSGTGNSLKVAKDVANRLGDTEVISISSVLNEEKISVGSENVGIVFPVYIYGIPLILSKFIDKLSETCKDRYFFALATYKSQPGGALMLLKQKLNSHGIKLSAGFNICMPGNNIVFYEVDSTEKQNEKFLLLEKKLSEIVLIIKNKNRTKIEGGSFLQRIFGTKILYKVISKSFRTFDKYYSVDDKCVGCGICVKVCPVKNISIKSGTPLWKHKCEQCLACINLCPNQAIQYKRATIGKLRYKNPFIELKELYNKD